MNEGAFGQYSVFCVFASVVGCVLVPLVAQILQHQSMECMILSAIVISLTAVHLNKKYSSTNQHSKMSYSKEYDKKRSSHNKKMRSNSNMQVNHVPLSSSYNYHEVLKNEKVCMEQQHQQYEHLKILELEKRYEEKKLRKIQKREEKLRRKEEESKKQKELEERYKAIKEKRIKSKEKQWKDKYLYCDDSMDKVHVKKSSYFMNQTDTMINDHHIKNKRFVDKHNSLDSTFESWKPKYKNSNLSIRCSSRTASCSSLSSISSSDSSVSPPLPISPSFNKSGWKSMDNNFTTASCWKNSKHDLVENVGAQSERSLKSYKNSRIGTMNVSLVSSSLFSGNTQESLHTKKKSANNVGEYKLFGPQYLTGLQ